MNELKECLVALMRELTDAPYDPREAFETWPRAVAALHMVGDHSMCDDH